MSEYTLERDVEGRLSSLAILHGWGCEKFIPDFNNGMPDRLLLLPGARCVWVETKTKGGRLSSLQRYKHKILRQLGQEVYVIWTKQQAEELIAELAEKYG
jgi:hypothetical protein